MKHAPLKQKTSKNAVFSLKQPLFDCNYHPDNELFMQLVYDKSCSKNCKLFDAPTIIEFGAIFINW
jgi:hypothetical protein